MTRQQEQIANHTYIVKRSSANNGLPYRQVQFSEQETEAYDEVWPPKTPRSALRYTTTQAPPVIRSGNRRYVIQNSPPPQTHRAPTYQDEADEQPRPRRAHWSFVFGIGMFAMLSLWVLGNIVISWWNVTQDDWHYGRPRTYQIDAVVQHNHDSNRNPSHFVAINYHSQIQIIEEPAGDASHAKIYTLPLYGQGEDLAVATLSFKDVNGDGKPDMIISVANTHIAYMNDNGQFRPLKPGEQTTPY